MVGDVSDRLFKIAGLVVVSTAAGFGILMYIRRKNTFEFSHDLPIHELEKLRVEVELLRIEVRRIESLVPKNRSPLKSRERSVTFEGDNTDLVTYIDRVKSTQSLASDGDYSDAMEEWDNGTVTIPCLHDPSRQPITIPSISFDDVDQLFGTDEVAKAYDNLKKHYDGGQKGNVELLWRLAKCCKEVSARTADKNKKKDLIFEGKEYALDAMNIDSSCLQAVKWATIMTGQSIDYLGTKEKIAEGGKFKEYLDKALVMDPNEYSFYHMRGRYSFSVASLSWLERKAASVLFGTPPTATVEEALDDFLLAFKNKEEWIENLFYIGRCYIQLGDKANAKKYLLLAKQIKPEDDAETALLEEATKLLAKC